MASVEGAGAGAGGSSWDSGAGDSVGEGSAIGVVEGVASTTALAAPDGAGSIGSEAATEDGISTVKA